LGGIRAAKIVDTTSKFTLDDASHFGPLVGVDIGARRSRNKGHRWLVQSKRKISEGGAFLTKDEIWVNGHNFVKISSQDER
jgi:hypothetical protein